ncbi:MAG: glycoside hydrolase family 32 protein [Bacteroidales bacterium]|nr:glycoside hydrolase family 32 protein [Bacteroidales bacterium]
MKQLITTGLIILMCMSNTAHSGEQDSLYHEKYRPQYHFNRPQGWIGDPCALIYLDGKYHLYYWGHATSEDLVHWEHHPWAIEESDSIGVMSGSAVIDWNNTSGFQKGNNPPVVAAYSQLHFDDIEQTQAIAYSNDRGMTFTKYDYNPVIDIDSREFRDPQVFWHEETEKWIMVITLSGKRKVRFYASDNLKDWKHLSDFGPVGSDQGVWECPDMFPLPVDGDTTHIKWVLEVDVQPISGQYFIGDFDGREFKLDENFAGDLNKREEKPQGNVVFDFENKTLEGWSKTGEAFDASPARGALPKQAIIIGYTGERLINSFYKQDGTIGKLTSPAFTIDKDYLNFQIGGGMHPKSTYMKLVVDEKPVRFKTGINTETMYWTHWNVSEFKGKKAHLEIVDSCKTGFGHINIDHVMLSDKPAEKKREKAFWIDYGPDFYAVRSWNNYPENSNRRIWIAWMGNWLYAREVPTKPWKGFESIPRSLALKTFPEGIRLVQQPIEELTSLRYDHFNIRDKSIEGVEQLEFKPERNVYELTAEFVTGDTREFGFNLCKKGSEGLVVGYRPEDEKVYVDRRHAGNTGFHPEFAKVYEGPLKARNGLVKLHIFIDQSSIEVFGNEGETVISCQVYPDEDDLSIELFSEGGKVHLSSLNAWMLKSVWKN